MITVIAPCYLPAYPVPTIITSMLAQTDDQWELFLIHDGPAPGWPRWVQMFDDPRIHYRSTRDRNGNWGHLLRSIIIDSEHLKGRYTHLTNADNYLLPIAVAKINNETADVVAWPIVHNYFDSTVLYPKVEIGGIDLSSVAVRTDLVKEIGFPWTDNAADFLWIQEIAKRTSDWKFLGSILGAHN